MARRYYLAPPIWDTTRMLAGCWVAPAGTVGLVDLRPIPAASMAGGTPQGYLFVATDGTVLANGIDLGVDLNTALTPSQVSHWKSALGLSQIAGGSPLDLLWQSLTVAADPTGQAGPFPLDVTAEGNLELALAGHSIVRRERFSLAHPAWPAIRAMRQADFKALRVATLAGGHPKGFHLRYLAALAAKYGCDHKLLLAPGVPDEGMQAPHTAFSEDFDGTNAASTLGTQLSWTILSGNFQRISSYAATYPSGATECRGRCDSDLSANDYTVQASIGASSPYGLYQGNGLIARKDSSATLTHYLGSWDFGAAWSDMWKCISGTYTQIGGPTSDFSPAPNTWYLAKFNVSGSTLTQYLGGVQGNQVTDSSISSGTRGGVRGYSSYGGSYVYWDNWSADDGISAPSGALLAQNPQDGITFPSMSGGMR